MFKTLWFVMSLFLILIIFLRMPQENIGLSSFANKSDIFGSPSSTQKTLNRKLFDLLNYYCFF